MARLRNAGEGKLGGAFGWLMWLAVAAIIPPVAAQTANNYTFKLRNHLVYILKGCSQGTGNFEDLYRLGTLRADLQSSGDISSPLLSEECGAKSIAFDSISPPQIEGSGTVQVTAAGPVLKTTGFTARVNFQYTAKGTSASDYRVRTSFAAPSELSATCDTKVIAAGNSGSSNRACGYDGASPLPLKVAATDKYTFSVFSDIEVRTDSPLQAALRAVVESVYDVEAGAPAGQVDIQQVEVVQVVQRTLREGAGTLETLVPGKTTYVRVYLTTKAQQNITSGIDGTLTAAGFPEVRHPLTLNVIAPNRTPDPDDFHEQLTFLLPMGWTVPGKRNLKVQLTQDKKLLPPDELEIEFKQPDSWSTELRMAYIEVCVPVLSGKTECGISPPISDLPNIVLPLPDGGFKYTPASVVDGATVVPLLEKIDWPRKLDSQKEFTRLTRALLVISRLLAENLGTQQLFAWIPNDSVFRSALGFFGGKDLERTRGGLGNVWWASGCPPAPTNCELTGRRANAELVRSVALNLGLALVPTGKVGTGAFDRRGIIPRGTEELLSFLTTTAGNLESSTFSFEHYLELHGLGPKRLYGASKRASRQAAGESEYLVISGEVSGDGNTGELDQGRRIQSAYPAPPSDENGSHCLRFSGTATTDYCFTPIALAPDDGDPVSIFALKAPYPAGTTKVTLIRKGGDGDLAAASAGSPPSLQIVVPAGGETWEGKQTIQWTASSPDGRPLSYTVEYSADQGATWVPLTMGWEETRLEVDTGRIAAGPVQFRVSASTGLDTTMGVAGPVTIVQNPRLEVDTRILDFRNATAGQFVERDLTITNSGTGPLAFSAQLPDGVFSLPFQKDGIIVPAGKQTTLRVQFAPEAGGVPRETLLLVPSNPGLAAMPITLVGAAFDDPVPSIRLSAEAFNFDTVNTGQFADRTLFISNTGSAPLTVTLAPIADSRFSVAPSTLPAIAPGQDPVQITIRFAPSSAVLVSSALTIRSNDPTNGVVSVGLTGRGAGGAVGPPVISISPDRLDYGNVTQPGNSERQLLIRNNGGSLLTIISANAANPVFSALPSQPLPFTIGPNAEWGLPVRFTPNAVRTESGTLIITSDDPLRRSIVVPLTGGGGGVPTTGTVLQNGDAEELPPNPDCGSTLPPRWTVTLGGIANCAYGTSGGPTATSQGPPNRGQYYFRGSRSDLALMSQTVTIPLTAAVIDSGDVRFSMEGFLGGRLRASSKMTATFLDAGGAVLGQPTVAGPVLPPERQDGGMGQKTVHGIVPANARSIRVELDFRSYPVPNVVDQEAGNATDAYADNLLLILTPPTSGTGGTGGTGTAATGVQLLVDDGSYELTQGYPGGVPNAFFLNRLTPPSYPATLRSVQIFFNVDGPEALPLGTPITVLSGSNPSGGASVNNIQLARNTAQVSAKSQYNGYNVTPITITSGDFVIGFTSANPPGVFPVAKDSSSGTKDRSYIGQDGITFNPPSTPGNFAIRAIVDLPNGAGTGPRIDVTPLSQDFGTVEVGKNVEKQFTVRNVGTADLNLTGVSSTMEPQYTASGFTAAPPIPPGGQRNITVRFAPTTAGPLVAAVNIASNDPTRPAMGSPVFGTGTGGTGTGGGTGGGGTPTANLIQNGDAEDTPPPPGCSTTGAAKWTTTQGNVKVCNYGSAVGPTATSQGPPNRGGFFFVGSGAATRMTQTVTIPLAADALDSGNTVFALEGYIGGYQRRSGSPQLSITYLDGNGGQVGQTTSIGPVFSKDREENGMVKRTANGSVPARARSVRVDALFQAWPDPDDSNQATGDAGDAFGDSFSLILTPPTGSGGGTGGGGTGPAATGVQLLVDDGSYELTQGYPGGVANAFFLNRLTPPSYPATLRSVQIFFNVDGPEALPLGTPITVLSGSNPSGGASINNIQLARNATQVSAKSQYNGYSVTPITITSGDFVIGFTSANPPGVFPIAKDSSSGTKDRSYIGQDGITFNPPSTPGNFAIRAIVDLPNGAGAGPRIDVTPLSLDFGSVEVSKNVEKQFTVRNVGTADLNLTGVSSTMDPQYTAPGFTAAPPIPPGGQRTVTVRFTPSAAGPLVASFNIASNDPTRPAMGSPVFGTATGGTGGGTGAGGGGTPTANLIQNGDAEDTPPAPGCNTTGAAKWTTNQGNVKVCNYGSAVGPTATSQGPPNRGGFFFVGSGPATRITQTVTIPLTADALDSGNTAFALEGFIGGYQRRSGSPQLSITYLDGNGGQVGQTTSIGPVFSKDREVNGMIKRTANGSVPARARSVRVDALFQAWPDPDDSNQTTGDAGDAFGDSFSLILTPPTGSGPVGGGTGGSVDAALVAWWKVGEAGGDTLADSTANKNDGMLSSGVTRVPLVPASLGNALRFDGDYQALVEGATPGTNFPSGNSPRTISLHVMAAPRVADQPLFEYGSTDSRNTPTLGLNSTGHVYFDMSFTTDDQTLVSKSVVTDNRWRHITAVYDGVAANTARLYVDGVLEGSRTVSPPGTRLESKWTMGQHTTGRGLGLPFAGQLTDIRVYNKALTPSEVTEVFARINPLGGPAASVPAGLDFGSVTSGQPKDLPLTVQNFGTSELIINSITGVAAPFSVVGQGAGLRVPAGGQGTITFRFAPTAAGVQSLPITITTNDTFRPAVTVTLSGTGLAAIPTATVRQTIFSKQPTGTGCAAGPPATSFLTTDEAAYLYVEVANAVAGDVLRVDFLRPDGSVNSSVNFQAVPTPGAFCFTANLPIAGTPAAQAPGTWTARGLWNGTQLFTRTFPITAPPAGGNACVAPPSGLVSWWPGDGNAIDVIGGNNGTLGGSAAYASGEVSQSFNFNGTSGFVQAGNPSALRLTSGVTLEAWVNPRSLRTQSAGQPMGAILTKWAQVANDTADSDGYGLWLTQGASGPSLFAAIHQTGPREPSLDGGTVPLNTWTHVAMTFDAAGGQFVLYVNGQRVNSSVSAGALFASTHNVNIGREESYLNRYFDGLIDETSIYSRALSAAEIQTIYLAGSFGKCKPPVTLGGTLEVSPAALDFGSVTAGLNKSLTFTLRNTGTATLTVNSLSGVSAPFSLISAPATPFSLSPGQTQLLTIRYAPTSSTASSGSLVIASNDASRPSVSVPLSGTGGAAPPTIDLSPSSLAFGSVAVGQTNDMVVTVNNSGGSALTVSAMTGLSAPYSLLFISTPFNVGGGSFQLFTVRYAPTASGTHNQTLLIASNDPARPTVSLAITGNATGGSPIADITPSTLAFGNVSTGQTKDLQVTVRNTGATDLTVGLSGSLSAPYSFVSTSFPGSSLRVAAGASQTLTVRFAPTAAGAQNRTFAFTTNDPNRSTVNVSLTGTGVAPQGPIIRLDPTSLDFGSVRVGQSKDLLILVYNDGTTFLTVNSVTGLGGPYSLVFTSTPFNVGANGSFSNVFVRFAPTATGAQSRMIVINSTDPSRPAVNVPISGQGAP